MRVRAARGAIVASADDADVVLEATERLLGDDARAERDRAGRPRQHPVHGDRRPPLGVPGRGRAADGPGPRAADVRPGDPGRGLDAVGDPAPAALPLRADARPTSPTCTSTARSRCAMTSTALSAIAVVGTGLIGTSIAMAAMRVAMRRRGVGPGPPAPLAPPSGDGFSARRRRWRRPSPAPTSWSSARRSRRIADLVAAGRSRPPRTPSSRTRAASRSTSSARCRPRPEPAPARFVGGHPMGGSERSGPEHASASVVDGIVWVLTPERRDRSGAVAVLEAWIAADRRASGADVAGRGTTGWWRS